MNWAKREQPCERDNFGPVRYLVMVPVTQVGDAGRDPVA